ncbi:MAG: heat-inducible transcriptional repressor HrcA [Actinomycetota bacterium]|nr:heat-inducible transcriptional repressor HrcA [Actinomycetota bacterium]
MADEDIGARQGAILSAVVEEFIRSGEPVGSKNLVGRYRLTVSAATVRNDMSHLEELGYLVQPHTSAGRIPTDLGYRFFVDHLTQPVAIDENQKQALERELAPVQAGIEELLQKATEILSRHTRQAAAVLAPSISGAKLRHLDLVRLSQRLVLVVIVSDNGRVDKRLVELDYDVTQADLDKAQRDLNKNLLDKLLNEAQSAAATLATGKQKKLVQGVADALGEVIQEEARMFVGGTANLAGETAFGELDTLHRIIEALESQKSMTRLLANALDAPTSVKIGSEVGVEDLQSCSVVIASYNVEGTPLGSVGVIGPTRMDYTRALAFTSAVARAIAGRFEEISG